MHAHARTLEHRLATINIAKSTAISMCPILMCPDSTLSNARILQTNIQVPKLHPPFIAAIILYTRESGTSNSHRR